MGETQRNNLYRGWSRAVERALRWLEVTETTGAEASSCQP